MFTWCTHTRRQIAALVAKRILCMHGGLSPELVRWARALAQYCCRVLSYKLDLITRVWDSIIRICLWMSSIIRTLELVNIAVSDLNDHLHREPRPEANRTRIEGTTLCKSSACTQSGQDKSNRTPVHCSRFWHFMRYSLVRSGATDNGPCLRF